jgi:hypothetical protein
MKTTNWPQYKFAKDAIKAIEERRHGAESRTEDGDRIHLSPAAEAKLRIDELLVFAVTSGKRMGWTATNIVKDWLDIYWTGAPEYMTPEHLRHLRVNVRMPDWYFASTYQKAYLTEVAERYVQEVLKPGGSQVRQGRNRYRSPSSEYMQIMRSKHYTDELREILKLTL